MTQWTSFADAVPTGIRYIQVMGPGMGSRCCEVECTIRYGSLCVELYSFIDHNHIKELWDERDDFSEWCWRLPSVDELVEAAK